MSAPRTESAVQARAPGKMVWLGEYAVLEGGVALVCAVDRFATATVAASVDGNCRVEAVNLGGAMLEFDHEDGQINWRHRSPELALAVEVLTDLAVHGELTDARPFHCSLDSGGLYAADGKLGLGSSAAVAAALARGVRKWAGGSGTGDLTGQLTRLTAAHQRSQHGHGSGVDIAAAVYGGVCRYQRQRDGQGALVEALVLPAELHWCAIYTGKSASTSLFLRDLARWRENHRADFATRLEAMSELSATGADALGSGDSAGFLDVVAAYHEEMAGLGRAAGIDIASAEHRRLREIAQDTGVAYKCSGAGGGDLGVAFATEPAAIAAFRTAAMAAGFAQVALQVADSMA